MLILNGPVLPAHRELTGRGGNGRPRRLAASSAMAGWVSKISRTRWAAVAASSPEAST